MVYMRCMTSGLAPPLSGSFCLNESFTLVGLLAPGVVDRSILTASASASIVNVVVVVGTLSDTSEYPTVLSSGQKDWYTEEISVLSRPLDPGWRLPA